MVHFMFKGEPIVPSKPRMPKPYKNFSGEGPYICQQPRGGFHSQRGTGPRGRGSYTRGGHQPRMVVSPNPEHHMWDSVRHSKFAAEGWYTIVTNTKKKVMEKVC